MKNTIITIIIGLILNLPGMLLKNLNLIAYASVATYFVYYLINRISIGRGMNAVQVSFTIFATVFILSIGLIIVLFK